MSVTHTHTRGSISQVIFGLLLPPPALISPIGRDRPTSSGVSTVLPTAPGGWIHSTAPKKYRVFSPEECKVPPGWRCMGRGRRSWHWTSRDSSKGTKWVGGELGEAAPWAQVTLGPALPTPQHLHLVLPKVWWP